ncbi:FecR domain-containing protein [Mucilaginibacter sp. HMF5004]|uniref:FecR family protein n=1 Tax=Mucilaginibacter rivuli TaxID=2857527 RepID=UPI001C6078C9|nr:FecR domain-containing protein [Mucilaginibacter rivuli]MBW4890618.1 FecR domain-containing protein [Mucilaginibacter rivuli]
MNTINWELLINYINGDCNDAEMLQVQEWCVLQPEHRYLLTYLERRQAQLLQPLKQSDIEEQWLHLLNRMFPVTESVASPKSGTKHYWFTGLAASLLLCSVLGWFYYRSAAIGADKIQVVHTNTINRGNVTLPDGTIVYLAPNSELSFKNFNGPKREVNLNGEAFFDVKHLTKKPFIIYTGNKLSVTVLGTSFNVYARKYMPAEVKVATGLVGVITNNKTHYLKAGQQLIANADNNIAVKTVAVKDALSLQTGTLFFNNSNTTEIAVKLQRWYNINVKVLSTCKNARRFSGEMKDTGIADLLKGLRYATGINYRFETPNTLILF